MGPIHVLAAFVPPMIEARRGGHVVNVSSAAGLFGLPIHAPYSAAKFGLRGVSEVLRFDLEPYRIGVTLVCPGAVNTPLVGTVDIVGVDRDDPRVLKAVDTFARHAASPEKAAAAIVRGVEKGRYMVYTSQDIRLLHWTQRYVPFVYTMIMRVMNGQARGAAERRSDGLQIGDRERPRRRRLSRAAGEHGRGRPMRLDLRHHPRRQRADARQLDPPASRTGRLDARRVDVAGTARTESLVRRPPRRPAPPWAAGSIRAAVTASRCRRDGGR